MKVKTIKNNLKILALTILLIASSFVLCKIVNASTMDIWHGTFDRGVPTPHSGQITGYFPQYFDGGIAFCNDNYSIVRWGNKDYNIYYPTKESYEAAEGFAYNNSTEMYNNMKDLAKWTFDTMSLTNKDRQYSATGEQSSTPSLYYAPRSYSISISWVDGEGKQYGNEGEPFVAVWSSNR